MSASQADCRRRKYMIDRSYQVGEASRGVLFFAFLMALSTASYLGCSWAIVHRKMAPVTGLHLLALTSIITAFLLFVYAVVTIRRTHRVAGAAYRIKEDIPKIITDPSFRFHLREKDYLTEIVEELNKVMGQLEARGGASDDLSALASQVQEALDAGEDVEEKAKLLVQRILHTPAPTPEPAEAAAG